MKTPGQIKSELEQFCGTENYYKYMNIMFTDGIKHLADTCECYWLLSVVASWQADSRVKQEEFQVFKLQVHEDKTAIITIEDGNGSVVAVQTLDYTDFCLDEIVLWYSSVDRILYLPSEH
ncbi:MAG: hypothetical protein NT007_01305 [Candidatus Kapabacteria bacterium]|nr:hypothetical protein [Candidatus Kapabacteria bacterium]